MLGRLGNALLHLVRQLGERAGAHRLGGRPRHAAGPGVDARHVGRAEGGAVEGAGDAPVPSVRHVERPHDLQPQQAAGRLRVHERLHLVRQHRPAGGGRRRCRGQRVVGRERPLVVDDHGLATSVHVDAVDAAPQLEAPVRERLPRAEVELEEGRGESGQERRLAVEVGHEPALQAVRLGTLEGREGQKRVGLALELGLERQVAGERLAHEGARLLQVARRHLRVARLDEVLVEALQHAMGEAAHLQRAEARVGRGQAQAPQREPLAGTLEVALDGRGRQDGRRRAAAGSRPARARQHDAPARGRRHVPARGYLPRLRVGRVVARRQVRMQGVLARALGEGHEHLGQPRRTVEVVRARGVGTVAVDQLLVHDGRVGLVRVHRAQHALAHHRVARARQRPEEAAARGRQRVAARSKPPLLQDKRRSVLGRAHRIRARLQVAQHEHRARARRPLGGVGQAHEQHGGLAGGIRRRAFHGPLPRTRRHRLAREQLQHARQRLPRPGAGGREAPRAGDGGQLLGAVRLVQAAHAAQALLQHRERCVRVIAPKRRQRRVQHLARRAQVGLDAGASGRAVAAPSGVERPGRALRHARERAEHEVGGLRRAGPGTPGELRERQERPAEAGLRERHARRHGGVHAAAGQEVGRLGEQGSRLAAGRAHAERRAALPAGRGALREHGVGQGARHERGCGVAAGRQQEAHDPRRLHGRAVDGREQAPQQGLQLAVAPGGAVGRAAGVVDAHDVGALRQRVQHAAEGAARLVESQRHDRRRGKRFGERPHHLGELAEPGRAQPRGIARERRHDGPLAVA